MKSASGGKNNQAKVTMFNQLKMLVLCAEACIKTFKKRARKIFARQEGESMELNSQNTEMEESIKKGDTKKRV